MRLEFELIEKCRTEKLIVYCILRKGLKQGEMVLKEPYNMEEAKCKTMIME